ncbi:MAG: hypothetical protein ACE5F1_04620, partial [Planctomycetota bacterium]
YRVARDNVASFDARSRDSTGKSDGKGGSPAFRDSSLQQAGFQQAGQWNRVRVLEQGGNH